MNKSLNSSTADSINEISIPQELIDAIIDLNKGNIKALRSCALVSKSFVARSQQHLFNEIKFGPGRGPNIAIKLRKILSTSPHLARYILTVIIEDMLNRAVGMRSWIYTTEALGIILPQMLHLRHLALKAHGMTLHWENFPEGLQVACRTLMGRGIVQKLTLYKVKGFPLEFVATPSLTDLTLFDSYLDDTAAASALDFTPTGTARQSSRWTSLQIMSSESSQISNLLPFIVNSDSGIGISGLKKLIIHSLYKRYEVEAIKTNFDILSRLIRRASGYLHDIWVTLAFDGVTGEEIERAIIELDFSLGTLPQLRTLNIDLESIESVLWHSRILLNVNQGDLPMLDTINIVCGFPNSEDPVETFDAEFWGELDRILTKPPLESVRHVNILYLFDWFQPGALKPMGELIRQSMDTLRDRGTLYVSGSRGRNIPPSQAAPLVV